MLKKGKNCVVIKFEKKLTLAITESTKEAGFLGFGGTNHRSIKKDEKIIIWDRGNTRSDTGWIFFTQTYSKKVSI